MNYLKNIGKSLLISFLPLLIIILLLTLLEYIGLISNNGFKIIITIISIFIFLTSGIIFGKKASKKGWLEGIKLSLIEVLIVILANISFSSTNTKNLIIYMIIFLATTIGSIIGVNTNNKLK